MPHPSATPPSDRPPAKGKGRIPADGSGKDFVARIHALAESIRRQLGARRQNRFRPGGPGSGVGGR